MEAYDPVTRHNTQFSGVLVSQLLTIAGVPRGRPVCFGGPGYKLTLGQSGLEASDAVLATRMGGDPIKPEAGGPVRLVFPGASEMAATPSNWLSAVASVGSCY
jgi:DMSO/TMAO reductase YedYZ molybdopterin-dependent catalytic subunit